MMFNLWLFTWLKGRLHWGFNAYKQTKEENQLTTMGLISIRNKVALYLCSEHIPQTWDEFSMIWNISNHKLEDLPRRTWVFHLSLSVGFSFFLEHCDIEMITPSQEKLWCSLCSQLRKTERLPDYIKEKIINSVPLKVPTKTGWSWFSQPRTRFQSGAPRIVQNVPMINYYDATVFV